MADPDNAKLVAANFILDLHYNPTLRNAYWTALNTRFGKGAHKFDNLVTALNNMLTKNGYKCTADDLGDGWDLFTQQSLLAWTSIYVLAANDASNTTQYKITVAGSKTQSITVYWDGTTVKDLTNNFGVKGTDGMVTWTSANNKYNVKCQFSHHNSASSRDPTLGNRQIDAKIWVGAAADEPADFNYTGHDFYSNLASITGTYATTLVIGDPADGTVQPGQYLILDVDNNIGSPGDATLSVSVAKMNSLPVSRFNTVSLAVNRSAHRNAVAWLSSDNSAQDWSSMQPLMNYQQGYINISWEWTPAYPDRPAQLTPTIAGAIYAQGDSVSDSSALTGQRIYNGENDDNSSLTAGIDGSVAAFVLIATNLGTSVVKLIRAIKGWRDTKAGKVDPNTNPDGSPKTDEEKERDSNQQSAEDSSLTDRIVPKFVETNAVDVNNPKEFPVAVGHDGKPLTGDTGEPLRKNLIDSVYGTTLGSMVSQTGKPSHEVLDSEGGSLIGNKNLQPMQPYANLTEDTGSQMQDIGGTAVFEVTTEAGRTTFELRDSTGEPFSPDNQMELHIIN